MFSDVYFFKKGRPFCCFASFDRAFGGRRSGTPFSARDQAKSMTRNRAPEWDALFQWGLGRKLRPGMRARNGMRFPDRPSSGNCIPDSSSRTGHTFPTGPRAKTASQNSAPERDTFSGRGLKWKPRPRIRNGIEAQFMSARAATLTAT